MLKIGSIANAEELANQLKELMKDLGVLQGEADDEQVNPFSEETFDSIRRALNLTEKNQLETAEIIALARLFWSYTDQKREIDELQAELENRPKHTQITDLEAQLDMQQSENAELKQKLESAERQLKGFNAQLESTQSAAKQEIDKLRAELENRPKHTQITDLNAQFEAQKNENEVLKQKLTEAEHQIDELNAQLKETPNHAIPQQQSESKMEKDANSPTLAVKKSPTIADIDRLKRQGLSDEKIAKALGTSRSSIYRIRKAAEKQN